MSGNWACYADGEVIWDDSAPDPDENTYSARTLCACGHWQTWEQFKGLPMDHDPAEVCWDCEPCDTCGLKRSDCRCDPFDDQPWPTAEEERSRMTAEEKERDEAWAEQEAEAEERSAG